MIKEYNIYIDESGDLGINKGTRWFAISAVIVKKEDEKIIRDKLNDIKKKLNMNLIHIRKIRSFEERALIVNDVNTLPFKFITVFVDTSKIVSPDLTPLLIYNHSCRYLLERASWYLNDVNGIGNIVLSSRGTSRDKELLEYIEKLIVCKDNQVKGDRLKSFCAKGAGSWDLLQLADICATSSFLAREINRYDFRTPCYLNKMSNHLYSHSQFVMNYGVKYYSSEMKPTPQEMSLNLICK